MLGPLVASGSHFLELLINVHAWSFTILRLPEAIRRALSTLGLVVGEVALVEQSRRELLWPVDVIFGTGGSVVLSGCWRAFTLDHHLLFDDRLIFRFKLGTLEASVWVFDANGVCRTYLLPAMME
jgi:hypothetical protein